MPVTFAPFLFFHLLLGSVSEALLFGAWMLAQVLGFVPNMQMARIAAARLFTILDRKPQIYSPKENNKSSTWVRD